MHRVQQHMKHHGEEYYDLAKAGRRAADSLPAVLRDVHIGKAQINTDVLVGMHAALKGRGGRKKRAGFKDSAPDLFAHCKRRADRMRTSPRSV